jgi:hypothetical protein
VQAWREGGDAASFQLRNPTNPHQTFNNVMDGARTGISLD